MLFIAGIRAQATVPFPGAFSTLPLFHLTINHHHNHNHNHQLPAPTPATQKPNNPPIKGGCRRRGSSRNTSTPASTRVVDLVRQHHGLPQHADAGLPEENGGNWRKQARSRHLHARRRQVNLSEIPESQYPVVLEIHGCSHFVILTAKRDDDTYCVQFPDSREADVSAERLEEFYDGQ